jgi:hypothetical protein
MLLCRDLHSLLDEYKQYPALSVHWIWVGPNGHARRLATGGVLPYYTMCSASPDRHIKTIVNTYFLEGVTVHPHNFVYRCGPAPCWCAPGLWRCGLRSMSQHESSMSQHESSSCCPTRSTASQGSQMQSGIGSPHTRSVCTGMLVLLCCLARARAVQHSLHMMVVAESGCIKHS